MSTAFVHSLYAMIGFGLDGQNKISLEWVGNMTLDTRDVRAEK